MWQAWKTNMTASFKTGVLLTLGDCRFQFIIAAPSSTATVKGLLSFPLYALLFQKTFWFLWFNPLWAILWHMTLQSKGIFLFQKIWSNLLYLLGYFAGCLVVWFVLFLIKISEKNSTFKQSFILFQIWEVYEYFSF